MNNFYYEISPIILLIFVYGCKGNEKQNSVVETKIEVINFEGPKNPLGFMYPHDTLVLTASFSDCGEFGGHSEIFKIFSKGESYYANYVKDSIGPDCPYPVNENKIIVVDTTFMLTVKDEKHVVNYLKNLFKRSLKGHTHDNSEFYSAVVDWKLKIWNGEPNPDWNGFRKLKRKVIE